MQWTEARPLRTGPGRALATAMNDTPGQAYLLAAGALDQATQVYVPAAHAPAEALVLPLTDYLAGVAAAAVVADVATGRRDWTGARDFAVNGNEVTFLPPEAVLLGTLTLALTAASRAVDLLPAWEAHPGVQVPGEFRSVLGQVQRSLAEVTQARMTLMAERAEDVHE